MWEGGDVYDVATAGRVDGALLPDRKKPALAPLSRGSRADRLFWSEECFCVGSCFPWSRMQERKERVQHGLCPQRALGVRQLWCPAHTGQGSHPEIGVLPCRADITTRRGDRRSGGQTIAGDSPAGHFL